MQARGPCGAWYQDLQCTGRLQEAWCVNRCRMPGCMRHSYCVLQLQYDTPSLRVLHCRRLTDSRCVLQEQINYQHGLLPTHHGVLRTPEHFSIGLKNYSAGFGGFASADDTLVLHCNT